MNIIDMYSARNRIINKTLLYSVLNPDTSSDSPSAKSKGDRFASASTDTNNSSASAAAQAQAGAIFSCERSKWKNMTAPSIVRDMDTSYLMV